MYLQSMQNMKHAKKIFAFRIETYIASHTTIYENTWSYTTNKIPQKIGGIFSNGTLGEKH